MAHEEASPDRPLASWRPGRPAPQFGVISHRARSRWEGAPTETLFVIAETAAAKTVGGSGGRFPRASEATHDLHVAAVYLWMRRQLPTRARSWRSEAEIARAEPLRHRKLPDAMVRDGAAWTAIEVVGHYSAEKLMAFHRFCQSRGYGYELW